MSKKLKKKLQVESTQKVLHLDISQFNFEKQKQRILKAVRSDSLPNRDDH